MRHANSDGYQYEDVPTLAAGPPYPPEMVAKSRALLAGTLELMGFLPQAKLVAARVAQRFPVHAERARIAASVVGVDPLDLLLANLCYDSLLGLNVMGCSTLALAGPNGPILARNMDWFPVAAVARASCLVGEEFGTNAGFLGLIGAVTGLSKRGFALCVNAAFGGSDPDGHPMLLFLRHVLDTATSYQQALELVTGERLMTSGIITVVGMRNNERAVVERQPKRASVRTPTGDEPLMATNHYRDLSDPADCPRYDFMAVHAGKRPPLEVLTNYEVLQEITAQHVVMCPAKQTAEMYAPSHLLSDGYRESLGLSDLMGFFTS